MAVGARARDILRQFLIEAVALCLVGGAMGILLAMGLPPRVGLPALARGDFALAIAAAVLVSAGVALLSDSIRLGRLPFGPDRGSAI